MSRASNYQDLLPLVNDFNATIEPGTRVSSKIRTPYRWFFNRSDLEQLAGEVPANSASQGYTHFAGIRLYAALGMNQDNPNITHITFVMIPMFQNGISGNLIKGDVTHILFEFARTCPPLCRKISDLKDTPENLNADSYLIGDFLIPRAFSIDYASLQNEVLNDTNNTHLVIERSMSTDSNGYNVLGINIYGAQSQVSDLSDLELNSQGSGPTHTYANHVIIGMQDIEDFPV
jgi:hypothetical protein